MKTISLEDFVDLVRSGSGEPGSDISEIVDGIVYGYAWQEWTFANCTITYRLPYTHPDGHPEAAILLPPDDEAWELDFTHYLVVDDYDSLQILEDAEIIAELEEWRIPIKAVDTSIIAQ